MATRLIPGQRKWSGGRDEEGHRTWKITHLVEALPTDGPYLVMNTAGLPAVGSSWNFDSDFDLWAWCTSWMKVTPLVTDEPNTLWHVEQKFITGDMIYCHDLSIEDPLLEPQKVSGNFVKESKEIFFDKDGNPNLTSSKEFFGLEFDHSNPTVRIEQNVAELGLDTFAQMVNTVNDAELWGLGSRKIKLGNVAWERKVQGLCDFYYTRAFEFEIEYNTFDKSGIPDRGTKELKPAGDKTDPNDFNQAKDNNDENLKEVVLDGDGAVATTDGDIAQITVQHYPESNFLLLGIPVLL